MEASEITIDLLEEKTVVHNFFVFGKVRFQR